MRSDSMQPPMCGDSTVSKRLIARRWRKQAGMTTLGFMILVGFFGVFGYAAIRLAPIYLNYVKIVGVVDGVRKEYDGQNPTRAAIKKSISRRFDIESITVISARDVKVTPDSGGFLIAAVYDHDAPFIANVSFSVHFDKKALVRR